MQISDILAQSGGLQAMARELGISEADAARGASALAPAILGGFKKQAQAQSAGLQGLDGMLDQLGGGSLAEDVLSPQPTNVSRGDEVLGQIFGSRDVSRTVAQHASAQAGLDPGVLKKMLPMLAMLITGYLSAERDAGSTASPSTSGGLAGMFGGLLGGGAGSRASGLGRLTSMLDMNKDGNPLDDVLRMAGR